MTQALYAHMNNKRKKKKLGLIGWPENPFGEWQLRKCRGGCGGTRL
jgi:hypothetical protein